jgi:hypothetical protein
LFAVRIPLFAINAKDDPVSHSTPFIWSVVDLVEQIAIDEALPYLEIKQTPYAVLCMTSLGGHLSWFEIGGHRWFARAAVNFLNKMAIDIQVDAPADMNGAAKSDASGPRFNPMRRRWQA